MKETIKSVSELLDILKELPEPAAPHPNIKGGKFFRGQSNYNWTLIPSLYRDNLFEYERILLNEVLHKQPDEFKELDLFSKLVKMQHYRMKTRLLDLSENPLVALYFACSGNFDEDGAIYILNNAVTHYSNDLLVQVTMDYAFNYAGFSLSEDDARLLLTTPYQNTMGRRRLETTEDLIYDLTLDAFCVTPKLNNQRLIAQQGTFLCFGMKLKEVVISDNPGNFGKKYFKFAPIAPKDVKDLKIGGKHFKMKIPKHAKPNILKELNNLNINRGSLFLDLEHQISDIHNSIKKNDY